MNIYANWILSSIHLNKIRVFTPQMHNVEYGKDRSRWSYNIPTILNTQYRGSSFGKSIFNRFSLWRIIIWPLFKWKSSFWILSLFNVETWLKWITFTFYLLSKLFQGSDIFYLETSKYFFPCYIKLEVCVKSKDQKFKTNKEKISHTKFPPQKINYGTFLLLYFSVQILYGCGWVKIYTIL